MLSPRIALAIILASTLIVLFSVLGTLAFLCGGIFQ